MANEVVKVAKGQAESAILQQEANGRQTLAGGLSLPVGTYEFTTPNSDFQGFLNVDTPLNKWSLPIVAGTIEHGGKTIEFVLSADPKANTLVVPNVSFIMINCVQFVYTVPCFLCN